MKRLTVMVIALLPAIALAGNINPLLDGNRQFVNPTAEEFYAAQRTNSAASNFVYQIAALLAYGGGGGFSGVDSGTSNQWRIDSTNAAETIVSFSNTLYQLKLGFAPQPASGLLSNATTIATSNSSAYSTPIQTTNTAQTVFSNLVGTAAYHAEGDFLTPATLPANMLEQTQVGSDINASVHLSTGVQFYSGGILGGSVTELGFVGAGPGLTGLKANALTGGGVLPDGTVASGVTNNAAGGAYYFRDASGTRWRTQDGQSLTNLSLSNLNTNGATVGQVPTFQGASVTWGKPWTKTVFVGGMQSGGLASGTRYDFVSGLGNLQVGSAAAIQGCPHDGYLSNLLVGSSAAVVFPTTNAIFCIQTNQAGSTAVDSLLSATNTGAGLVASDTTHSVDLSSGTISNIFQMRVTSSAATAAATWWWSVEWWHQ